MPGVWGSPGRIHCAPLRTFAGMVQRNAAGVWNVPRFPFFPPKNGGQGVKHRLTSPPQVGRIKGNPSTGYLQRCRRKAPAKGLGGVPQNTLLLLTPKSGGSKELKSDMDIVPAGFVPLYAPYDYA
jgi:hypothetical protein